MSNDSAVTVEHDALVLGTVRVTFQRTSATSRERPA